MKTFSKYHHGNADLRGHDFTSQSASRQALRVAGLLRSPEKKNDFTCPLMTLYLVIITTRSWPLWRPFFFTVKGCCVKRPATQRPESTFYHLLRPNLNPLQGPQKNACPLRSSTETSLRTQGRPRSYNKGWSCQKSLLRSTQKSLLSGPNRFQKGSFDWTTLYLL